MCDDDYLLPDEPPRNDSEELAYEDEKSSMSRRMLLRGALAAGGVATIGAAQLWRPDAALAAVTRPKIYTTDEWGAAPPKQAIDVVNRKPIKIIIHHTATANSSDFTVGHAFSLARGIQQAHFNRGWRDSGQQFTISRGGHILTGRHRSRTVLIGGEKHVIGAHCTGQNDVAVGIENEGTYTNVQIRDYHYKRLVRMCAFICQKYGIDPARIRAHREFVATQCPGDRLFARMPKLRDDVRARLAA
ncbi:MAG: peptidoglycan recognition protein family protein [Micromonosporaceae bacterium]